MQKLKGVEEEQECVDSMTIVYLLCIKKMNVLYAYEFICNCFFTMNLRVGFIKISKVDIEKDGFVYFCAEYD